MRDGLERAGLLPAPCKTCSKGSIGTSQEGRQMGKCSLLISNYFTTASSHQPNMGSGCVLVWVYSGAFSAREKVFPHTNLQPNWRLQEKGRRRKHRAELVLTCSNLCSESATGTESTTPASHICPLTARLFFFVSLCAVTDRRAERRAICTGQENAGSAATESEHSIFIQKFCDRKRF